MENKTRLSSLYNRCNKGLHLVYVQTVYATFLVATTLHFISSSAIRRCATYIATDYAFHTIRPVQVHHLHVCFLLIHHGLSHIRAYFFFLHHTICKTQKPVRLVGRKEKVCPILNKRGLLHSYFLI